ncbi:MAG: fibronectin type III domain-containing protein, partial [Pirellulales bacterium]|nr:fibronectin type III domain-containing protein [Pirellulales bacterium]
MAKLILSLCMATVSVTAFASDEAFVIESPRQSADSVLLNWEPESEIRTLRNITDKNKDSWRVFYRKVGEDKWRSVNAIVQERFHNVIFLEPKTEYEF